MRIEKLIHMGNQIATFFKSQDQSTAAQSIAEHINKFWEPRMRLAFLSHADVSQEGFEPLLIAAIPHINKPD